MNIRPPDQVTVQCKAGGLWGERLARAVNRLRVHPYSAVFIRSDVTFEMPRIFAAFSGDISGRYIEFFSLYALMGYPTPELATIVEQVLPAQKPSGYFGEEGFDKTQLTGRETKIFWGNGRLLIGLMEYYRLTNDPQILAAATRLGDFLFDCGLHESASAVGKALAADGGAAGFATTFCSCIEGIVRLYEITGDARYAKLAQGVAALLPDTFESFHSHGRITALRGMVDLARATDDARMMDRVIRQWNEIESEHLTSTGGIREHFGATCHHDEGCSVADWVMLSLKLFSATGQPEYLRAAEHCFLNHLLATQFENGGFGHQPLLPTPVKGHEPILAGIGLTAQARANDLKEAYWCCSFHGPRAVLEMASHLVVAPSRAEIAINLPLTAQVQSPDWELQLTSDLFGKSLEIDIRQAPASPMTLRILVPSWANHPEASILAANGKPEPVKMNESTLVMERTWRPGDRIQVEFHPALRVAPALHAAEQVYATDKEAVFFGPLLLGYECSDPLLWGQMVKEEKLTTTLVLIDDHPQAEDPGVPMQMIVEYHDAIDDRTIWSPRALVPAMLRCNDQPLRTVHTIEHRPFASLNAAQQEELTSSAALVAAGV